MFASTQSLDHLSQLGYVLLHGVFDHQEMESLAHRLTATLDARDEPSVLRSRGRVYGSRDLITAFPEVCELSGHSRLKEFINGALGSNAGLVRALYFDKPPDRSWSLPWHRDRTIAVRNNDLPTTRFRKPTFKAGIPHVEAPEMLLANMLTLRVHLDAMTADNGPLSVIPGSHLVDQQAECRAVELRADAGDVLVMRPLLSHSSSNSRNGTTMHRRVIHLEFASRAGLPDDYEWYFFKTIV